MASMGKRFFVTVLVNISKALLSFSVGIMLARGLGVEDYGRYSYLLASFISIVVLLDLGASNAFYTFISKGRQSRKFFKFYFTWFFLQIFLSTLFFYFLLPESIIDWLFLGENVHLVTLAFLAAFFQSQVWNLIAQLLESQRETIKAQTLNLVIAITNFLIILLFYLFKELSIKIVFTVTVIQFLIALIYSRYNLFNIEFCSEKDDESYTSIFRKFKSFCLPLFVYFFISFFYQFFDARLLQYYGGSHEQAYFSVSKHIATVCLIFTTSLIRILWKEVSEADENKDFKRVEVLYIRSVFVLYLVGTMAAGAVFPWGKEVIDVLLGVQYQSAVIPFMIMLLYPIHQSIGQVLGTMFYATEKTATYSLIGIFSMLLSLGVSFILLSDGNNSLGLGFDLGAVGLSTKMVIVQLITVNVCMYFIAKIRGWKYEWLFQIYTPAIIFSCSFALSSLVKLMPISNVYVQFTIFGSFYGSLCVIALIKYFSSIGLQFKSVLPFMRNERT